VDLDSNSTLEALWWRQGLRVAGIDEAGRGALAGPVVAAAVILPPGNYPFRDSKTLSPKQRTELAQRIREEALAWSLGWSTHDEIDALGILAATLRAAERALAQLVPPPHLLLTDYLRLHIPIELYAPPKADRDSLTVAAASILAKVARDEHMIAMEARFPGYGFSRHKGYPTQAHREALARLGPSPIHRRRFRWA
jgi:ribonuclease HII